MIKTEQDLFRIAWQRQKFPELADQVNRLNGALGHIERAVPILTAYAEKKANSARGNAGLRRHLRGRASMPVITGRNYN
jgi:hypothetical protein